MCILGNKVELVKLGGIPTKQFVNCVQEEQLCTVQYVRGLLIAIYWVDTGFLK